MSANNPVRSSLPSKYVDGYEDGRRHESQNRRLDSYIAFLCGVVIGFAVALVFFY